MTIADRVREIVETQKVQYEQQKAFCDGMRFVEDMSKAGVIKKIEYNIPLVSAVYPR